jgi:hypothetical protein
LTFSESQVVANEGIKSKNILLFGLGLHTVGDFLPHANLSGKWTVGHQEGRNEDGSESHWHAKDADWTYKNPSKALSTFKIFLGKWDQFSGNETKTELTANQLASIDKFIRTKSDDWKGKVEAFEEIAKAAGTTNEEWAMVYKFFSQKQERVNVMERAYKSPKGKASIDLAENLWKLLRDNDNMFNTKKTEVPSEHAPPPPPAEPEKKWAPFQDLFIGLDFEIRKLYGVPY